MVRHSALVDRGREPMTMFPQHTVRDRRGVEKVEPDFDSPYHCKVNVSTDRQSDAELDGQVSNKVLKVLTRNAPAKPWARVYFRGEQWDLATPEARTQFTRATTHTSFILRSRNQAVPDG